MTASVESQFDTVVHQSLTAKSIAKTRVAQQIHSALLQNTRANAFFDIFAAARFQYNRVDSL